MLNRCTALVTGLAALMLAPNALATNACAWEATRARNDHDALCYRTLGPTSENWSPTPDHETKLEQCLLEAKRMHWMENAKCIKADPERKK